MSKNGIKEKVKKIAFTIVVNLLLFLIAVYLLVQYFGRGNNILQTEKSDIITRQEIFDGIGYVFRNESTIINNNTNGFIKYEIENGHKIGKNQIIALLYNNASDLNTTEQVSQLERQINILKRSNVNIDYVTTNVDKVELDLHEYYVNMLLDLKTDKINLADRSRDDMLVLINKRQIITSKIQNFDHIINEYEERKKTLISSMISGMSNVSSTVKASESGIFYYNVDGYEDAFGTSEINSLNIEKFESIIDEMPNRDYIEKGLGKLVKDYKWYIVCKTEKRKTFDFDENRNYDLMFSNSSNKTIRFKLIKRIDDFEKNEELLIFETMENPTNFNYLRKQSIKIVYETVTGLRVPESALRTIRDKDGNSLQGVYVLKGNVINFRILPPEECLGKYDNYYIYKHNIEPAIPITTSEESETTYQGLKLYDVIITSGKDLYEGKALN